MNCPKCDSPQPHLHPAVQHEGEVEVCDNNFHKSRQYAAEVVNDAQVAQRIRDWFQGEKNNQGVTIADSISDEIDAMIAEMTEPLPPASQAWKDWNDWENSRPHNDDPMMLRAMDLCKFAEWSADVALGFTDEPFSGVPRIVISVAKRTGLRPDVSGGQRGVLG